MGWLLFFLAGARAFAVDDVSLFFQSAERIWGRAGNSCAERPVGKRLREEAHRLCGAPLGAWRHLALSLIDLPSDPGRDPHIRDLKEPVARNAKITEAYAQIYLFSLNEKATCGRSVLPWAGGAVFGSLKSGQLMRSGLSSALGSIPAFDRVKDANYRPRFEKRFTKKLAGYVLEGATITLGQGNRAIYTDLSWQLLAGTACGPGEVVRAIKAERYWERDEKLARSAAAWEQLIEASRTCDEEEILAANFGLVDVEQVLVGQEVMYQGLIRRLGGWMLSPLIENAVPRALARFPSFPEHARYTQRIPKLAINFASPRQRVPWMKDQLRAMEEEFQANAKFLPTLLCAAIDDAAAAEAVLNDL